MKPLLILLTLLIGSTVYADDTIKTDTNSTITSNGAMETTINSPPPSAISPQISASNSDLCTVGVAWLQTRENPDTLQILRLPSFTCHTWF